MVALLSGQLHSRISWKRPRGLLVQCMVLFVCSLRVLGIASSSLGLCIWPLNKKCRISTWQRAQFFIILFCFGLCWWLELANGDEDGGTFPFGWQLAVRSAQPTSQNSSLPLGSLCWTTGQLKRKSSLWWCGKECYQGQGWQTSSRCDCLNQRWLLPSFTFTSPDAV